MKTKKIAISILIVLVMVLGLLAVMPFTASAAAINAVWWTDANDMTDFTASINTAEWVSSSDWYKLKKYDEAQGDYVQVQGACGYVGTRSLLDFETVIRQNGSGKYKVEIETTSGITYESAEKTYTFEGALDAPQNLRWDGETVLWDPVEGADRYDITVHYKKNESSDQIWSTGFTYGNDCSADFSGQFSNPGTYYFMVEASSEDEMLVSSSAKSPEKTVSYTYSELNAHFGNVNNNERKYTLYWDESPDATGYYMVLSKKNGEAYQPVSGFENILKKLTGLDLYAVMEANGEGDYKVDFFAFNTSPTIPVSNEVSIEITFTNCEHSYTKEIQTSYYLHSASSDCTANTEYYYACEHCGEMAPKEAEYVYEGDIGEHDMIEEYQANGAAHWHGCSKCDYVEHLQTHTLDENNYCATCDTTVYDIWLGDIQVTSKNCDDITGDGSAFYMPELNRLFLTNYTDPDSRRVGISITDPDNGNDYVAMIYAKNGLNLRLRGENFLYEDAGDIGRQYAVVVENGDLKIEGSGSLYANATVGFYTMDGDIYIDKNGGLLDVVGYYAIRCEYHKLYINDGKVKLRSHAGNVYTSAPVLDDYGCYYAEISNDYGGADPEEYRPTTNIKYFYIEPAYTVTIEPFECEGDYITEVFRYGTEYTLPECPYTAPDGKAFYKWGVTPPGNMYEVGEKFTITENLELTPIFKAITPTTLTATYSGTIFAGNKITPENISITLTYSDSSTQPVNAGEVEYWYGGVQIADPVNYVFGTELIGDMSITVKYEGLEATMAVKVVGHEITFNANGGTGEMAKAEYVGEYTLPTCTFTAPTGKQFKGWATSADGSVIEGTTYNVTANVEFFAIWENIPVTNYTINATAGANGTISPSGEVTVAEGEDKTFTITANSGYHIKDVKVNGSSVGTAATYTFNDVSANATITVEFEVDTVPHVCNPTLVPEDEPDCTTAGKSAYYHCECGKNYEDAQGNTEIDNLETWGIQGALGHDAKDAWSSDADNHWKECVRCAGQQLEKAAHTDTDTNGKCDVCEYQMSTAPDDPNDDKDGLGAGVIVGIVIGSVAVAGIGGFALFWFVIKKKSFADLIAVFKKK